MLVREKKTGKIKIKDILMLAVIVVIALMVLPNIGIKDMSVSQMIVFLCIGIICAKNVLKEYNYAAFSLNIIHWIFVLFFFCLTPVTQIIMNFNPWGVEQSVSESIRSGIYVLIWMIFYILGSNLGKHTKVNIRTYSVQYYNKKNSLRSLVVLMLCSLCFTLFLIENIGLKNMFARSTAAVSFEGSNAKMLTLVFTNSARAIILYAATILLLKLRTQKKHNWIILIINMILLLVACFPSGMARNNAGIIYFGLIIIFLYNNKANLRKSGISLYLFLFGFMIIFPAINIFRRLEFGEADFIGAIMSGIGSITENYLSEDYDAFSIIADVKKYVDANGITYGKQFLGAMLFFVPRSIWSGKPVGSGQMVFKWLGMRFTNVSCPLIAEGYINFGLLGIIIFAFFTGYIASLIDKIFWNRAEHCGIRNDYLTVLYPFLTMSYFFLLRGDLMTTWAYMAAYIVIFYLMDKVTFYIGKSNYLVKKS